MEYLSVDIEARTLTVNTLLYTDVMDRDSGHIFITASILAETWSRVL